MQHITREANSMPPVRSALVRPVQETLSLVRWERTELTGTLGDPIVGTELGHALSITTGGRRRWASQGTCPTCPRCRGVAEVEDLAHRSVTQSPPLSEVVKMAVAGLSPPVAPAGRTQTPQ